MRATRSIKIAVLTVTLATLMLPLNAQAARNPDSNEITRRAAENGTFYSNKPLVKVERLAGGLIYAEQEDGNWAIAPWGSTLETRTIPSDDGGFEDVTTLTPPDESVMLRRNAAQGGPSPSPEAIARSRGLLMGGGRGVTSAASSPRAASLGGSYTTLATGGSWIDGACTGKITGNNGWKDGCYNRYRDSNEPNKFGVEHHAQADANNLYLLQWVYDGAEYMDGTAKINDYRPTGPTSVGDCQTWTVGGTHSGMTLSVSGTICDKLIPLINSYANIYKAKLDAGNGTFSGRGTEGTHWFYRPPDTQSGFKYILHFYAV